MTAPLDASYDFPMTIGDYGHGCLLSRPSGTLSSTQSGGEKPPDFMRAWRPVTGTNGAQSGGGSPRAARTPPASSGRNEWLAARRMVEVAPLNAARRFAARAVPPVTRCGRRTVSTPMIAVTGQGGGEEVLIGEATVYHWEIVLHPAATVLPVAASAASLAGDVPASCGILPLGATASTSVAPNLHHDEIDFHS